MSTETETTLESIGAKLIDLRHTANVNGMRLEREGVYGPDFRAEHDKERDVLNTIREALNRTEVAS